eukprot:TRINITY_DN9723_c0_g1_i2.p1 TRINITY_DN9723_c0_g1~~TRINITY_DN9723_c0_g1_i2.p1  ORF type:complete len:225 (+),score=-22.70 TRINITY_DN9723_c0_g1_i2:297-971(+)
MHLIHVKYFDQLTIYFYSQFNKICKKSNQCWLLILGVIFPTNFNVSIIPFQQHMLKQSKNLNFKVSIIPFQQHMSQAISEILQKVVTQNQPKNQPQPFPSQCISQAISTKHQQQYVNLTLFGLRQNPKIFLAGVLQSTQMQNYKILITKYHKQNWKLSKCIHRLPIIILNRKQTVKQTSDWSVLVAYSFHNHQNTQILVEVHTTKNQRMSQTLINYSQQLILTL